MSARTALVYPGQGAQHVGMGVDVAASHPAARAVFDVASDVLGLDLLAVCRDGPASELVRTDLQQPAILAVGAAVTEALRAGGGLRDDELTCTFGLSLGEFTALWAAGALELADALRGDRRTRSAVMTLEVKIWADSLGQITRTQLVNSTGDTGLDSALRNDVLGRVRLPEPPPADMPMPINLRITARKAH